MNNKIPGQIINNRMHKAITRYFVFNAIVIQSAIQTKILASLSFFVLVFCPWVFCSCFLCLLGLLSWIWFYDVLTLYGFLSWTFPSVWFGTIPRLCSLRLWCHAFMLSSYWFMPSCHRAIASCLRAFVPSRHRLMPSCHRLVPIVPSPHAFAPSRNRIMLSCNRIMSSCRSLMPPWHRFMPSDGHTTKELCPKRLQDDGFTRGSRSTIQCM